MPSVSPETFEALYQRFGYGQAIASGAKPPADPRFALVDLGSSNGSFLRIRNEIELVRGDHFRVGQQLFRVDLDGSA